MDISKRIREIMSNENCVECVHSTVLNNNSKTCIACKTQQLTELFEPVKLKPLSDRDIKYILSRYEEIEQKPPTCPADYVPQIIKYGRKITESTIAKYGQLYRIKEG